jgi:hypothetical protein
MAEVIADLPPPDDSPSALIRARFLMGRSIRRAADLVALIYIGFVAAAATVTGAYYMLFPELSALSWDVMERPRGRWANAPLMLALTPALTGFVGTIVTRTIAYGFVSVFLTVLASLAILRSMRSPIAPAISAGLLPLVLGVTSWWYSPSILFGTSLLALISVPWKRYAAAFAASHPAAHSESTKKHAEPAGIRCDPAAAPEIDSGSPADASQCDTFAATSATPYTASDNAAGSSYAAPSDNGEAPSATAIRRLLPPLLTFMAIAMAAVKLTGMRFILFPPLVVILYEMLSHREHCPWVGRPIALPVACFVSALGGYFFFAHLASAPIVAMLSMAWGIAVLRTLNLHMPPVLAVALLPLVMAHPTIAYPISVGLGTTLASAWFELLCRWRWVELISSSASS